MSILVILVVNNIRLSFSATGGASTDYGGGRGSANDSFSSSEPYYSSFSDQGGGGSGSSGVGYGTGATGGGGESPTHVLV